MKPFGSLCVRVCEWPHLYDIYVQKCQNKNRDLMAYEICFNGISILISHSREREKKMGEIHLCKNSQRNKRITERMAKQFIARTPIYM